MSRRNVERQQTSATLSNDQLEDFKQAFKIYSDNNEMLTADALSRTMQRAGIRGDATKMLQEAGASGSDGIDHLAFQTMMARKLGQGETRETVEHAFQTFDWKRSGKINRQEIETALTTMGEPVTRTQLSEVSQLCVGGDGEFYWEKFVDALFGGKDQ